MNITDRDHRFLEELFSLSDETKIRLIKTAGKGKLPFLSLGNEYDLKKCYDKPYYDNISFGYLYNGEQVVLPKNIVKVKRRKRRDCGKDEELSEERRERPEELNGGRGDDSDGHESEDSMVEIE